jgi:hypothetical protein
MQVLGTAYSAYDSPRFLGYRAHQSPYLSAFSAWIYEVHAPPHVSRALSDSDRLAPLIVVAGNVVADNTDGGGVAGRTLLASRYTSAYFSIRLHTPAYVSIRQHTSAYVSIRQHASAYVSIRQHTAAYGSIRQHTAAYVSIRQHTSAYGIIRQHTSAYVSIHSLARALTVP